MASDSGTVQIFGKDYHTVALRVAKFREKHPDETIKTELVRADDERLIVKATIKVGPKTLSTGYAEEIRGSSDINTTSALENCETSAVGRALAFFGLAGTEIRSADEMSEALIQQGIKRGTERLIDHQNAVKANWDSVVAIKEHLLLGELSAAWEAYNEIPEDDRIALRVAPTKGGIFTVEENKKMKEASDQDFDPERGVYRSIADK